MNGVDAHDDSRQFVGVEQMRHMVDQAVSAGGEKAVYPLEFRSKLAIPCGHLILAGECRGDDLVAPSAVSFIFKALADKAQAAA